MKQFLMLMIRKTFPQVSLVFLLVVIGQTHLWAQCVTAYPYLQNFDSGAAGWTASVTGITGWTLGTPAKSVINSASSAPNSWITGGLNIPYTANNSSWVNSPCFDFSSLSNPAISMRVWWESEFSWDGAALLSSIDGGLSWQVVGGLLDPVNWYTDNSVNGGQTGGPCGQLMGWTGRAATNTGSQMWVTAQHKLDGLAGQSNVRFRICFASDFSNNYDGFAFDDIIIADLPAVNLGPDTVICITDTLILDACVPSALEYQWTSSVADTFCTKTVLNSGFYIVIVKDTLGFIVRDTIQISVSPTNVQLPPAQLICPGDTVTLNASNPWANHLWLPGNVQSQTLDVFQTGIYTVVVSDSFGCVSIDSVAITVDFVPDVDLGSDTTICIGESIVLDAGTANPGTTYLWNFGSASSQTIIVTAPGTYIVTVTTAAQCFTSDTMNLSIQLSPVVNLGPDRIECGEFSLNANNAGSSFLWSTAQTSQTITSTNPGQYWVQVTNVFGCANSDTVNITKGTIPTVDLGPDLVVCNNQTVTINAGNPGSQYLWSTSSTAQSITVGTPGEYSVQVTNADDCTASDTIKVVLSPLTVELGPNFTICNGDSTLLNAGNTGDTYMWSTGATTPTIYITSGGTYAVTVMDTAGCVAQDAIIISAQANFVANFDITPDTSVLYQVMQFSDLSGGNPTSWLWDFGDGLTSTQKNPTHAYQSIDTFTICLTVSDGICTNTVCQKLFVDIFAGLEEELGLDLNVYPNPNDGQFSVDISLENAGEVGLEVFDLSGRILYHKPLGYVYTHSENIQLNNVAAGLYLLKVSVENVEVYRKIMVR
ncbi:MAG: PKD domain-containing protein [Bacteroidia bacterium]|nr:PKD domain-containing protein [Bacteroidia bacterium]